MAMWDKVFITTNVRPAFWYYDTPNTDNLQRRICKILEVSANDGTKGIMTERDKRWAFDKMGNTRYEGTAY